MTEHRTDLLWRTALVAIYFFSRVAYYSTGVRFDISPLDYFFQYLDPVILRDNLWEGLLYLHSQPVMFNAFLGLVLKTGIEDFLFPALFILLGLGTILSVYGIAVFLGVNRIIVGLALAVFIWNPSFVAYENHLFYTWPAATLLSSGLFLFVTFLQSRRYCVLFCYLITIFFICGVMSIYHFSYFVVIFMIIYVFLPRDRKALIALATVPFLFILALNLKNYVLYGKFISSSWIGIHLMENFSTIIPHDNLLRLAKRGEISNLSLISTFSPVDKYFSSPEICYDVKYKDIAAIAADKKSNGFINFNHACYLYISDSYQKDFQVLVRKYPDIYLIKMSYAWQTYFLPASDYEQLRNNVGKISAINNLYDRFFLGKTSLGEDAAYPGLLLGLPLSFAFALLLMMRRNILTKEQKLVIGLICFNIAYLTLIANFLTCCSNNRIRFSIDPLYLILFCCLTHYAVVPMAARVIRTSWWDALIGRRFSDRSRLRFD
jgi:hypothetical protein